MFQVKVFNGNGELKYVISPEQANKNCWKHFVKAPVTKKPKGKEKLCDWCQEPFTTTIPNKRFCSPEHQNLSNAQSKRIPEVEIICASCKEPFMGTASRRFCNDPCSHNSPKYINPKYEPVS